jgi:hypothetical protein
MDIIILTTVILAGIAFEGFLTERARRRAEHENTISDRAARVAGRRLE